MRTNKFSIGGLIGVHVTNILNKLSRQSFFLRKDFKCTEVQIKPKPTHKTKLSEQKTTKATDFCAQELLRGRKLLILSFLKKLKLS